MTQIQLRRGTAAEWTAANPVLAVGEQGLETDTGSLKLGNGVTSWTALPYFTTATDVAGVKQVVGTAALVDGANSTVVYEPTTRTTKVDVAVPTVVTRLDQMDDVILPAGALQGGVTLAANGAGQFKNYGTAVKVVPFGTIVTLADTYPGTVILYQAPLAAKKTHTMSVGAAAAAVGFAAEGFTSALSANLAVYVTDAPAGAGVPAGVGARSGEFVGGTSSFRAYEDAGLVDATLYYDFWVKLNSTPTTVVSFLELRSEDTLNPTIAALQIQLTGAVAIKNKATTVLTTPVTLVVGTWYRVTGWAGGGSQQVTFRNTDGTEYYASAVLGSNNSGIPSRFRIGHTVGASSGGNIRVAYVRLSDTPL